MAAVRVDHLVTVDADYADQEGLDVATWRVLAVYPPGHARHGSVSLEYLIETPDEEEYTTDVPVAMVTRMGVDPISHDLAGNVARMGARLAGNL